MFTFHESTRAAVDRWTAYLDDILGRARLDVALMITLDLGDSCALPLAYLTKRLRELFANYDARPPLRIALISDQSAMILLIYMLAQIAAADDENTVQYHQSRNQDDAFQWLFASP